MRWPQGFLWGTGASSTQAEGASPASDWYAWEQAGRLPRSGDGNGFATRYAEDFALLAGLGLVHHRLSLDWARIEPAEGDRDAAAVAHYRDVLQAARDAGVTPWVTLLHMVCPQWFTAGGGFLVASGQDRWRRHVDFVAETFGDLVGGWKPVNETNYFALGSYRGGSRPPGHDDREEFAAVSEAVQLATAEAAVLLKQTGRPVSSIFGLSPVVAMDAEPETVGRAASVRAVHWDAGLGLYRDGVLRVPGRSPVERPDLAGSFDLIGFSYYTTVGIAHGSFVPYPVGAPVSPLGYGIDARGLETVLDVLAETVPGAPLLVAEYGVGTDDDDFRAQYLRDGLAQVQSALARGIDVRGFFHWTGVDNYEWNHGFGVSFGVISRDRVVRPSAHVLAAEALPAQSASGGGA